MYITKYNCTKIVPVIFKTLIIFLSKNTNIAVKLKVQGQASIIY